MTRTHRSYMRAFLSKKNCYLGKNRSNLGWTISRFPWKGDEKQGVPKRRKTENFFQKKRVKGGKKNPEKCGGKLKKAEKKSPISVTDQLPLLKKMINFTTMFFVKFIYCYEKFQIDQNLFEMYFNVAHKMTSKFTFYIT